MKCLYIIPARGGSKGIPGKNIKDLGGVPLIGHTIRRALEVAPAEDIVISTDSPAIAEVATREGVEPPFLRPSELATDTAGSRGVMLHALDWMNEATGRGYDTIVLLQPTSPFRTADDIRRCLEVYAQGMEAGLEPDMAVTVAPAKSNPYYGVFEADGEGMLHISKGDGRYVRRQDAPEVWEFNGAVYVIKADSLRKSEISQFRRILPSRMDAGRSLDLDTMEDWERAERIIQNS